MFEMTEVESSNIRRVGWSPLGPVLRVQFRSDDEENDRVYDYEGVQREKFEALLSSPSKGRWFQTHIRGHYPAKRIK